MCSWARKRSNTRTLYCQLKWEKEKHLDCEALILPDLRRHKNNPPRLYEIRPCHELQVQVECGAKRAAAPMDRHCLLNFSRNRKVLVAKDEYAVYSTYK